jgi:hypothetical protein
LYKGEEMMANALQGCMNEKKERASVTKNAKVIVFSWLKSDK